jgi:predicted type IV restriction endonuclease
MPRKKKTSELTFQQHIADFLVREHRPGAEARGQRKQLIADGTLIDKDGFLVFTKDAEFSGPSAAAAVIHGGSANGLTAWKTEGGKSLKQLDEQA